MIKRVFDCCVATVGLVVTAPLWLLISIAVKLDSPGPVLFSQERVGRHGRHFRIHKFRTMVADAERRGGRLTIGGDARITRVGRFLRRHKLDELPQLLNVIRGDMSLVGPRPEVPEFVELFGESYARVLSVRPGITHRATLWFRNEEQLLAATDDPDGYYLRKIMPLKIKFYLDGLARQSFLDDLKTIVWTVLDTAHALTAEEVEALLASMTERELPALHEAVMVANLGPAGVEEAGEPAPAPAAEVAAETEDARTVEARRVKTVA